MKDNTIKKLVFAALFAALSCAATMVIRIPTPIGGYIHAGDAVVLLSAFLLGPWWGAAAAGLGSGLADLIAGYGLYVHGRDQVHRCAAGRTSAQLQVHKTRARARDRRRRCG